MEIFGKEIAIKSHGCNVMDEPGQKIILISTPMAFFLSPRI